MEQDISKSGKSTYWVVAIAIIVLGSLVYIFRPVGDDASQSAQNTEQVLIIPEVATENTSEPQDENLDFASQLPMYDGEGLEFESTGSLPELVKSDQPFSQDVLAISAQLQPSLFQNELIRKIIFSINDMAQGMRPPVKRLRELAFSSPFTVTKEGDKLYMSEASYHRYDELAQAVNSIDEQAAVALYQKYLPLFQQVFAEFSYPENYQVLDIIKSATAKILEAPFINKKIELIHPTVRYKFADPKLEKLSSLDKQMLRMGPENTRIIQDKLRKLAQALIASEKE